MPHLWQPTELYGRCSLEEIMSTRNISGGKAQVEPTDGQKINVKIPRKLIEDEERESGNVKWAIYNTYLKASCVRQ